MPAMDNVAERYQIRLKLVLYDRTGAPSRESRPTHDVFWSNKLENIIREQGAQKQNFRSKTPTLSRSGHTKDPRKMGTISF